MMDYRLYILLSDKIYIFLDVLFYWFDYIINYMLLHIVFSIIEINKILFIFKTEQ